ncbi:MAG: hypothetical protein HXS46_10440 [Theionarchaea archaeon]|nr:hypothetical protein [Theionarchaea archaeon]
MKRLYILIFLMLFFSFFGNSVNNLPQSQVLSRSVDLYCYNCSICMSPYRYYGREWFPRFYFWKNVWIAGSDNVGTLYFHELPGPEEDEYGPPLLVYKSNGQPDPPYAARFLPAGQYLLLIDGECFHAYNKRCTDVIYFYVDDGTGPKKMSVDFETDKKEYGREDTSVLFSLQVTDQETGEYIEVDSIAGTITLPDATEKTVETEDWSWNGEDKQYEYYWNFTNDEGEFSDPEEGFYSADMTVEKSFYQHVMTSVTFGVCYHVEIDLEFNKDILEYTIGELVEMTVCVTDEDGSPVDAGLESVLYLPDGSSIDLEWAHVSAGVYVTTHVPQQEGAYFIEVGVKEDINCYLEEAFDVFYVRDCIEAVADLEIGDAILHEPVTFVLTVTDSNGNPLSGGEVKSLLYLPDGSSITLVWTDQKDGTYTAGYTPSLLGLHSLCGYIIIVDETGCYRAFLNGNFYVSEKKLPDLVIRNEDITVSPEPKKWDTVTISVTVHNEGDADAQDFWVLISIDYQKVYRHVEFLAAGESMTIEFRWKFKYSGDYIIQAIADVTLPRGEIA